MFRHVISTDGGHSQEPRMAKWEGTPARLMDTQASIIPRGRHRGRFTRTHAGARPELASVRRTTMENCETCTDYGRLATVNRYHSDVGSRTASHDPITVMGQLPARRID